MVAIRVVGFGAPRQPERRICYRLSVIAQVIVRSMFLWPCALFDLCNQILDADHCLIVSASMSARECPVVLPDLQSRLARLPVFQVQTLGDDERVSALQLRAQHRGLDLPDDTARYLLKRSRRDMASLYALLDKLDLEALRAQRRLTIPFVKGVLEI